jgi:hypothetical protein
MTPDDINGAVNADYCFIGDPTGATITGSNNLNGNPKLNPLGNYGGATLTHQPQSDSPLINAATDWSTLGSNIDNVQTTLTDADPTGVDVGFTIRIDDEQLSVIGKAGNTLTVTRGANATTAAGHLSGAGISSAFDQRGKLRKIRTTLDIGATEWVRVAASAEQQSAAIGTNFATGLQATISNLASQSAVSFDLHCASHRRREISPGHEATATSVPPA